MIVNQTRNMIGNHGFSTIGQGTHEKTDDPDDDNTKVIDEENTDRNNVETVVAEESQKTSIVKPSIDPDKINIGGSEEDLVNINLAEKIVFSN